MDIHEDIHLEYWSYEQKGEIEIYENDNLRIEKDGVSRTLFIKNIHGEFQPIKKSENLDYWEVLMYDNYLNKRDADFEMDYSKHISDQYLGFEYLIVADGNIYGLNDIFDTEDKFRNEVLERLYKKGNIKILNISEDFTPLIYNNYEWESIEYKVVESVKEMRKKTLEDILNI